MVSFPELDVLDESIRAMFAARTARPVGIADVPSGATGAYAVIDLVSSGSEDGGWGNPTDQRDFNYQIRCVGTSPQQCRWMQQRISTAATDWLRKVDGVVGYTEEQQSNLVREQERVYSALTQLRVKARVKA